MNSLTCQSKKKIFFLGHIKPPAHVLTEINASPINTAAAAVANIAAVAVAATNGRKRTRESNDELLMVSI